MLQNKLFIRIALAFLAILIVLAGIVSWITFKTSERYYDEANQHLHANLAQYTTDHLNTFTSEGEIDTNAINMVMQSMMVINPDVEVYLLDPKGEILTHVAPYKKVVREKVDLAPIQTFIQSKGSVSVKGDDPRDFEGEKIFSAAPVMDGDQIKAYYYIILASEERLGILNTLRKTYALQVGVRLIILAVGSSILLGLLFFWYQLRPLNKVTEAMTDFRSGNYSTRISAPTGIFQILSTTFNSMAIQIEQHVEKIKSVDNFRKELIANISHDLRTPLSILRGYTETLQLKMNTLTDTERLEYTNRISESSKRLNGLVNQLFELSNLENNQVSMQNEPFSLDELVKDLVSNYEVLANRKDVVITFDRRENMPLAYGDISLVERVIQNLMDNALKYTQEGGKILLDINFEDNHLVFKISDTGVGLPEQKLSAVFERYTTIKNNSTKGTGLGLAIANKIMELHNSKLKVWSKVNEGTTFSFDLPVYSV